MSLSITKLAQRNDIMQNICWNNLKCWNNIALFLPNTNDRNEWLKFVNFQQDSLIF